MSVLPGVKQKIDKAMAEFGGCFAEKGLLTSILGPFILGMGMTLSGAVSSFSPYPLFSSTSSLPGGLQLFEANWGFSAVWWILFCSMAQNNGWAPDHSVVVYDIKEAGDQRDQEWPSGIYNQNALLICKKIRSSLRNLLMGG